MWRRAGQILVLVSMLLSLVVATAWARSYSRSYAIVSRVRGPQPPHGRATWVTIQVQAGHIVFDTLEHQPDDDIDSWGLGWVAGNDGAMPRFKSEPNVRSFAYDSWHDRHLWATWRWSGGGFSGGVDPTRSFDGAILSVASWLVLTVVASPMLVALVLRWRRRRRFGQGCCTVCGYDLRATPDRCPECGQTAA